MKGLVAKEALVPRRWGGDTRTFGIKLFEKGQICRCKKITKLMFRELALR